MHFPTLVLEDETVLRIRQQLLENQLLDGPLVELLYEEKEDYDVGGVQVKTRVSVCQCAEKGVMYIYTDLNKPFNNKHVVSYFVVTHTCSSKAKSKTSWHKGSSSALCSVSMYLCVNACDTEDRAEEGKGGGEEEEL